ncbi:ABC transporter ATP-binding protein [Asticcacaulis tiandongensis]|uniref:ABC transporter ATP-binding protein n=1 Tax=Asticcacaulis tiandongensis TaxID=2565365 RepID=UPI00112ADC4F|nr:ABC transporter ATP-binding protein [Asticcacaulis tiandongensis]
MNAQTFAVDTPFIEARGLTTSVRTKRGEVPIVTGFDLSVRRGETVAIVGESGCGKSLAALSLMQLLPKGRARVSGGEVRLDGRDILTLKARELNALRGREIALISQDPMSALNPVISIGAQLREAITAHSDLKGEALHARAIELMRLVQIPDPEARLREYPHRLSGGMCQRVSIAMAIASQPRLLIADEPTTALDVTIQAQVLQLLQRLKRETGMALLIITHDFGVVAEMADRVAVMYAGRIVEEGPVREIFRNPRHPYTQGLLALTRHHPRGMRLPEIAGLVPAYGEARTGCAFADRCPQARAICRQLTPERRSVGPLHDTACWLTETGEVA